jgi:hypothetical protein
MFQFAFGLAAAKRLGNDFAIDDGLLEPCFTLNPWRSPLRRAARAISYRAAQRLAPFSVVKVNDDAEPEAVLAALLDRTHYAGFFQSAGFFADAEQEVTRAFAVHSEHERAFHRRYAELAKQRYVCCHVRRTDYLEWAGGVALPASYYEEALARIEAPADEPVVVIGDDLEWFRSEVHVDRSVGLERNHEAVDLLLLSRASSLVLSNSSFAWWGGWLNRRAARVLAPRHWLGFRDGRDFPPAIALESWEQVPV